jgi:hypothetical protein
MKRSIAFPSLLIALVSLASAHRRYTYEHLVTTIMYAIWHQGMRVYVGPHSDTLLTGQQLRIALVAGFDDKTWGGQRDDIATAPDIESATKEAIARCKTETPAKDAQFNLEWVWKDSGYGTAWALYEWGQRGKAGDMTAGDPYGEVRKNLPQCRERQR